MTKLLLAGMAALSFALTPSVSMARDHGWRDGHGDGRSYGDGRGYGGGYDYRGGQRYRDNHEDDAIIAGVAGLAIGAILGSALAQDRYREQRRGYDAGPPPRDGYGDDRYGAAYGPGYGGSGYGGQCFRRELVWDPRLRANVEVTHPIPC